MAALVQASIPQSAVPRLRLSYEECAALRWQCLRNRDEIRIIGDTVRSYLDTSVSCLPSYGPKYTSSKWQHLPDGDKTLSMGNRSLYYDRRGKRFYCGVRRDLLENRAVRIRRFGGSSIHGHGYAYEGGLENGRFHGYGRWFGSNGHVYEGHFQNGMRCGYGKYIWPDGCMHEGHFQNDQTHGYGRCILAKGHVYEGHFQNGIRHGYGIIIGSNDDRYVGQWENDRLQGEGEFRDCMGKIFAGIFHQGVYQRPLPTRPERGGSLHLHIEDRICLLRPLSASRLFPKRRATRIAAILRRAAIEDFMKTSH